MCRWQAHCVNGSEVSTQGAEAALLLKKMLDKFKKFVIIYLDKEKGCIKTAKPLANLFDRALKRSGFYGV